MEENSKSGEKGGMGKPKGGAEPTSGLLTGQAFLKSLNEALQKYLQSLNTAYSNGLKKFDELQQEYQKMQREQQTIYDDTVKEDYRNYVSSAQQAWGQEQVQTKMDEATRGYLTALNERQTGIKKNLDELQKKYIDTVQKHVSQVQEEYATAYQDYLKAFQQGLMRVDLENVDSQTLASVGQVLIAASNFAGQSLQMA